MVTGIGMIYVPAGVITAGGTMLAYAALKEYTDGPGSVTTTSTTDTSD